MPGGQLITKGETELDACLAAFASAPNAGALLCDIDVTPSAIVARPRTRRRGEGGEARVELGLALRDQLPTRHGTPSPLVAHSVSDSRTGANESRRRGQVPHRRADTGWRDDRPGEQARPSAAGREGARHARRPVPQVHAPRAHRG